MPLAAVALLVSSLLISSVPSSSESAVRVVIEPHGTDDRAISSVVRWVAPHAETVIWADAGPNADQVDVVRQWMPLQVVGQAAFGRLPIWDPSTRSRGWVQANDVGPIDPALIGTAYLPPIGRPVAWGSPARITMYTCVELGGCNATASGLWPTRGMVAVDPSVIPLGTRLTIPGYGVGIAADTGGAVRGNTIDIWFPTQAQALRWGRRTITITVH
jgi:3D (Asp-Asp-Asp) domain-containing protein